MENIVGDIYGNNTISISNDVYDKDFDDVGWESEIVDDGDEEAAELYGL